VHQRAKMTTHNVRLANAFQELAQSFHSELNSLRTRPAKAAAAFASYPVTQF
jgi:hypothetical protein